MGVGIDSYGSRETIFIYPNPANKNLFLQLSETLKGNITFQIYDVVGREASPLAPLQRRGEYEIDISSLSSGVYFLKINEGENTVVKKFLKEWKQNYDLLEISKSLNTIGF